MNDQAQPSKFHKSFGNVEDEEISDGEILLIRALLRDTEQQIISYRLKEIRVAKKIKRLMDSLKPYKQLAKEAQDFIDKSPLFALVCQASTITPELGRRKFYSRINDTVKRKSIRRKGSENYAETTEEHEFATDPEDTD